MSRKKTKASAKTKAKKTVAKKVVKAVKATGFKLAESMEKDFRAAPAKIAAQHSKDLAVLKQQEKKLMNELQKIEAKHKSSKVKAAALANKANAKKAVIAAAKKLADTLAKSVTEAAAKLQATKAQCKEVAQKQARFATISKQLTQIEKQLDAKAKEAKAPKAKATKARKKTTKNAKSTAPQADKANNSMNEAPDYSSDMEIVSEELAEETN
jgi:hypothetical protein